MPLLLVLLAQPLCSSPPPSSTQSCPSDSVKGPPPGSLQLSAPHTQGPGPTRCGGRRGHCTPRPREPGGDSCQSFIGVEHVWCYRVWGLRGGFSSPLSSCSAVGSSKAEATGKGDGTAKRREEEKRTVVCGRGWQAPCQGPQTPPTLTPDTANPGPRHVTGPPSLPEPPLAQHLLREGLYPCPSAKWAWGGGVLSTQDPPPRPLETGAPPSQGRGNLAVSGWIRTTAVHN